MPPTKAAAPRRASRPAAKASLDVMKNNPFQGIGAVFQGMAPLGTRAAKTAKEDKTAQKNLKSAKANNGALRGGVGAY